MTSAITKSLELLDKLRLFKVKSEDDGCYEVTFKNDESNYPLSATYCEEQGWLYYVNGVYNNSNDWVCVNVDKLRELMSFCESLGGDAR